MSSNPGTFPSSSTVANPCNRIRLAMPSRRTRYSIDASLRNSPIQFSVYPPSFLFSTDRRMHRRCHIHVYHNPIIISTLCPRILSRVQFGWSSQNAVYSLDVIVSLVSRQVSTKGRIRLAYSNIERLVDGPIYYSFLIATVLLLHDAGWVLPSESVLPRTIYAFAKAVCARASSGPARFVIGPALDRCRICKTSKSKPPNLVRC